MKKYCNIWYIQAVWLFPTELTVLYWRIKTKMAPVKSGIAQGSVIGPILFVVS